MRVRELLDALEDVDPNAEVRLAFQPNYPLEYSLDNVVTSEDVRQYDADPKDNGDENDEAEDVVWLTVGSQLGYLQANVFEAAE